MSVSPDEIVLSFNSHRARNRSGVHEDDRCTAVYSFRRASHGGYYRMPRVIAETYTHRTKREVYGQVSVARIEKVKGVSVLRAPYDDIGDCWG